MFYLSIRQDLQIELLTLQKIFFNSLFDFQSHTKSAHETGFRRNDDRLSHKRCHGHRNRSIVTDTALHEDFLPHRPVALDPVRIVHADGVDQSGYDVLVLDTLVNGVLDVRGDKRSTLIIEVGRILPFESDSCNIFHFYAQRFICRLFQK